MRIDRRGNFPSTTPEVGLSRLGDLSITRIFIDPVCQWGPTQSHRLPRACLSLLCRRPADRSLRGSGQLHRSGFSAR